MDKKGARWVRFLTPLEISPDVFLLIKRIDDFIPVSGKLIVLGFISSFYA